MSSSTIESQVAGRVAEVSVTDKTITINLKDGRTLMVPTAWYPRLKHATARERANYEVDDDGVFWPDVEADFSIRGILLGRKSGESSKSFRFWLENRKKGKEVSFQDFLEHRRKSRHRAVQRKRVVS